MKELIEKLRMGAAICRKLNNTAFAETAEDAARAIESLDGCRITWLERTQWVQDGLDSGEIPSQYWGWHRADIIKDLVLDLKAAQQTKLDGDGVTDDTTTKQDSNPKKHFKYTPITHLEAWEAIGSVVLVTSSDIATAIYSLPTEAQKKDSMARLILNYPQWYKMEECRVVGIEEAYRVLERGGRVSSERHNYEAAIGINGSFYWKDGVEVVIDKNTLHGWVVLDEGKVE